METIRLFNELGQAALSTPEENPPTAAEVIAFLQRFPLDSGVYAYDGEHGPELVVNEVGSFTRQAPRRDGKMKA